MDKVYFERLVILIIASVAIGYMYVRFYIELDTICETRSKSNLRQHVLKPPIPLERAMYNVVQICELRLMCAGFPLDACVMASLDQP
jgi:hypothetical protein